MKNILFSILILISGILSAGIEGTPHVLSEKDHKKIKTGDLVIFKKKIGKTPWPELTVYSIIKAPCLDSTAVFFAYHEHKEFIPDMIKSDPSKYISPTDLHIDFEMNIPWPIKNSIHTTGNKFSRTGKGYKIEWYNVKSSTSRDTWGSVTFLPQGSNTLFIYKTYIYPKSKLAGLFKKKMIKGVILSVKTIIERIELIKNSRPEKLPGYISAVERTLRGEFIYKNIPVSDSVFQHSKN
ncbi:MAG: hypothetical protein ABFR36_01855 [Acidobacteriota bacterium]